MSAQPVGRELVLGTVRLLGDEHREDVLARLGAEVDAAGGRTMSLDAARGRVSTDVVELSAELRLRRQAIKDGADLVPLLVVANRVDHLGEKGLSVLLSLARQVVRLNAAVVVTDSRASLPPELASLLDG